MKTFKFFVIAVAVIIVAAFIISFTNKRDRELMKVKYCYDGLGQHYVEPNENCTH